MRQAVRLSALALLLARSALGALDSCSADGACEKQDALVAGEDLKGMFDPFVVTLESFAAHRDVFSPFQEDQFFARPDATDWPILRFSGVDVAISDESKASFTSKKRWRFDDAKSEKSSDGSVVARPAMPAGRRALTSGRDAARHLAACQQTNKDAVPEHRVVSHFTIKEARTFLHPRVFEALTTLVLDDRAEPPRAEALSLLAAGTSWRARFSSRTTRLLQLYGATRVRLYPPSSYVKMRVFPRLHVGDGHSTLVAPPGEANRTLVLRPGEVVAVPPYWFHTEESLSASLIYTSEVNHPYQMIAESAMDTAFPFYSSRAVPRTMEGAAWLTARGVLKGVFDGDVVEALNYFRGMIHSQYTGLFPDMKAYSCIADPPPVPKVDSALEKACLQAMDQTLEKLGEIPDEAIRKIEAWIYAQGVALWIGGVESAPDVIVCLAATPW